MPVSVAIFFEIVCHGLPQATSDPTSVDLDHVGTPPPRKFKCPPKRDEIASSNQQFSGKILIFRGVSHCLAGYFIYQAGSPHRSSISLQNISIPTEIPRNFEQHPEDPVTVANEGLGQDPLLKISKSWW